MKYYKFNAKDRLFLDTNIWLFIYGPQRPNSWHVRTYSNVFGEILTAKSHIFIDVLVVSEFINRYARMVHAQDSNTNSMKFKDFRKSNHFKSVATDIANSTKRVIRHCHRISSEFRNLRIEDLLDEYSKGEHDFNDQVIAEICKRENLSLITDDADFKVQGIKILSANYRLLK